MTMLVRILVLLCIGAGCAHAQNVYRCVGKDGSVSWQSEACSKGQTETKSISYNRAAMNSGSVARTEQSQRESGWRTLCSGHGAGESYISSCVDGHVEDFDHMQRVEDKEKSAACFLKWYREQADVIDANMWRYCYYN